MSGTCPPFDGALPYAQQVLAFADCHTLALAQNGYHALSGGGWIAPLMVTAVALLGYRMMLGAGPGLAQGAGLATRMALVVTLATQWPAYQVLVFDVVRQGPVSLAGAVMAGAGLGRGDAMDQAARLDVLVDTLGQMDQPAPEPRRALRVTPGAGPLRWAGGVMMAGAVLGWLATRMVAAVMLALGPVAVGGLMFAPTRGLAMGWVRMLIGAVMAQVGVAVALGAMITMAEGQVSNATLNPDALLVTAVAGVLAMMVCLWAGYRAVGCMDWSDVARRITHWRSTSSPLPSPQNALPSPPVQRVGRVVAAVHAMDRRVALMARGGAGEPVRIAMGQTPMARRRDQAEGGIQRLGERTGAERRRALPRPTLGAKKRDEA